MGRLIVLFLSSAILLGGIYFYQEKYLTAQPISDLGSRGKPKRALEAEDPVSPIPLTRRPESTSGTTPKNSPLNSGFLASFLRPRLNFLDVLDRTSPAAKTAPNNDGETFPSISPKTAGEIRTYLINSSDLFSPDLARQLIVGTMERKEGKTATLVALRDTYREKLELLKALASPQEIMNIHLQSVEAVEKQIAFIDSVIDGTHTTLEEMSNARERRELIELTQKTREELKQIILAYKIHLPEGVVLGI